MKKVIINIDGYDFHYIEESERVILSGVDLNIVGIGDTIITAETGLRQNAKELLNEYRGKKLLNEKDIRRRTALEVLSGKRVE